MKLQRWPTATIVVFTITATTTALQFRYPSMIATLRRTPAALSAHEYWRLLTPILINPESWLQIVVNLAGLAVIGFIVERNAGPARWLLFYFVGALTGELAGLAWKPFGAGSSVAICGLLGALAAFLLKKSIWQPRIGGGIIVAGAIVLTFLHDLHGPPLLVGALLGFALNHPEIETRRSTK
jgi:rhomboid protease GluP